MTRIFKYPSDYSVYWAVEESKKVEQQLGILMAYQYATRDINIVLDDIEYYALACKG